MSHHMEKHPADQSSVDIVVHCAYEAEHCADQCIDDPMMAACARLCRDCAQICWTTAGFMSRSSRFIPALARTCLEICEACATECEKHDSEHCKKCAIACRTAAAMYKKIVMVGAAA